MNPSDEKPRMRPNYLADGRVMVSTTQDLRDALAAGYSADRLFLPDASGVSDEVRREAYAQGFEQGRNSLGADLPTAMQQSLREQGALAERARIGRIHALTEPGLECVAEEAIAQGASVEQFALMQLAETRDRGITISAIRADSPPIAPHAAPPSDASPRGPKLSASEIFARRKQATQSGSP